MGTAYIVPYSMSKAALLQLTKSLAVEDKALFWRATAGGCGRGGGCCRLLGLAGGRRRPRCDLDCRRRRHRGLTANPTPHFGPYCISPFPKDQSSRPVSTRLIQTSSFRTPPFSWISLAI